MRENWKIGNHSSEVVSDTPQRSDDNSMSQESIEYYGGHLVCESVGNERAARLITAAPDLLEALQEAVKTIRLWHGFAEAVPTEAESWEYYQASPEMKKINAAIKKATV